jgi:hypothetical protein
MPIFRKQQILSKLEPNEGTSSNPGAVDAEQVFDPQLSDDVDVQSRVPAGPTLSRDFDPVGRQSRTLTFRTDLRGSGSTSTAPGMGKYLQPSGYQLSTLKVLTLAAVTGGPGFQIGEQVFQGASYATATAVGVLLGILSSANAPKHRSATATDKLVVAVVSGTFANTTATVGNSSASTSTITALADYTGFCYQPTSKKLVRLQVDAWSAGTVAAGDVLKLENATTGALLGAVQIDTLTSQTDFEAQILFLQDGGWHATPATNRLRSPSGNTTLLNAAQTATKTPSITHKHNIDGRLRESVGSRGDFTLEGESGGPMQFAWSFVGDLVDAIDAPQVATSGLSTVRPPRLLGAFLCYGLGNETYRLATKRIVVNNAGTVSPNQDGNRPGGTTGSNITDRNPTIVVTVDEVNGAFDWELARKNGTPIRVAFLLGTTQGNIVAITAPLCQVTAIAIADADGVAGNDVTLAPKRIRESGDDELYIAQL